MALPIGDFNEASRVGFGLSSQADYYLSKTVSINLSAGYLSFQGKSQNISGTSINLPNLNIIPILAGTRLRINTKFFTTAQLGLSFLNYKGVKSSDFTYVIGFGYQLSKTDLQLRYNSINTDGSTLNYLGLRFAYNF